MSENLSIIIPRRLLLARYPKDELVPKRGEVFQIVEGRDNTQISDRFKFSFWQEAVLYGLLVLLDVLSYAYSFIDMYGYFPTSLGKRIYYLPFRSMVALYHAIGLDKKGSRHFCEEGNVKKAIRSLLDYRHSFIYKTQLRERTSAGKKIYCVSTCLEPLFDVVKYGKSQRESDFLAGSRQEVLRTLRKFCLLINPSLIGKEPCRDFRKLNHDFFGRIERCRKKLALEDNKRYWKREACFLGFMYYLMKQRGIFIKNTGLGNGYEIIRAKNSFLSKIGLDDLICKNRKYARAVF